MTTWWRYRIWMRRPRPWQAARHRIQRARRGWSDADTWNLDTYLTQLIAGALTHLADRSHGYPAESSPEEWAQVLQRIAGPLAAYGRCDWETADEDLDEYLEEYRARVDAGLLAAQGALRLLAKHLADLWD